MRRYVDTQAIVQASMRSGSLPGAPLVDLAGFPVLQQVVQRCQAASCVDRVVVATSEAPEDQLIVDWCKGNGVGFVTGCDHDVLDRFVQAGHEFPCRRVVRATSACPLIDPGLIDAAVLLHRQNQWDFVTNTMETSFPTGLDVEVLSVDLLRLLRAETTLPLHREQVTLGIRQRPKRFRILNLPFGKDVSRLRFALEQPRDLDALRALLAKVPPLPAIPSMYELIRLASASQEAIAARVGKTISPDRELSHSFSEGTHA